MRVVVPQITWHSRQPILSVDFDPTSKWDEGSYRVATGGGDCQLLVWRLVAADTLKPEFTCVAELKRHEKPLNVVRFSPDGTLIGTGGDDAYLILWKCVDKNKDENWQFEKTLRKHIEDVSDLSWSPDGLFLISASIDNSAVLWDVKKGIALHLWNEKEHSGFVHGVAYDPLHEFAVTMCIDRNLRFFDLKTKKTAHKVLKYPEDWISSDLREEMDTEEKENDSKSTISATAVGDSDHVDGAPPAKKKAPKYTNRLFHDEFLPTFCRRLSFSPRGELLLVPGGLLPPGQSSVKLEENMDTVDKASKDKKPTKTKTAYSSNNATIVFCRHSWTNPCAVIPTLDSYAIATRFCPIYFKKNRQPYTCDPSTAHPTKNERSFASINKIASPKDETNSLMKMPYRLVYAIATNDTVIIGDTASSTPLAVVRSIHLARITDVTWAADGLALMVSSTDNYCSLITFGRGELGEEFCVGPDQQFPALTRDCFPVLPSEPKPDKPKRKSVKPVKDKDAKGEPKTPTSAKKEPVQSKSKNIITMFSAIAASSSGKPNDSEKPIGKIYPMTPPKPIAVRRAPTTSSPLVVSSSSYSSPSGAQQKRPQGDVTPEEVYRLTTAPIKCREILEQGQPMPIMESSNCANSTNGTATTFNLNLHESEPVITAKIPLNTCATALVAACRETPSQNVSGLTTESPKVTDPNCPPSPVSSSSNAPRPPRRISLIPAPQALEKNAGKLD